MKIGETVIIGWCGYGCYLVRIDEIRKEGFFGPYYTYDKVNKRIKDMEPEMEPYQFAWSLVDSVERSKIEFPKGDTRIVLNKQYTAIVSADKQTVTVGCQKLPASVVLQVAEALR